jgi:hypothetical protein
MVSLSVAYVNRDSRYVMPSGYASPPPKDMPLFRRSWFVSWMYRVLMGVAKIKISHVNRQGKQGAQNSDRIVAIKGEINQQQYRSDRTALPKTYWNNTLPRAFRGDPLNNKARPENDIAAPTQNFPAVNRDPGDRCVGEQMKAVHTMTLAKNTYRRESFPAGIFV